MVACPKCRSENTVVVPGIFFDWIRMQYYDITDCLECGYSWRSYFGISYWIPISIGAIAIGGLAYYLSKS